MARRLAANAFVFLLIGCNPLGIASVHAALGGDAASVVSDADDLHGTAESTLLAHYDIQEITNDNGMRVREFLTKAGVVFAVAWNGPAVPDLQRLLGTSFDTYTKSLSALKEPGMHRSLRIATAELVVEAGGHMRAYSGRAYLPRSIPAGVSAADLR
ncbi:MAG TPA: DUF2844 domain-containing protein [Steroidobacteraceae bacterium]|jgi:hypothetical protein|nr:DUF2844 domain-containing protein [Steroidobacteraceae bacterium]